MRCKFEPLKEGFDVSAAASSAAAREAVLEKVWGWDYDGTARTVDNFLSRLRKIFESVGEIVEQYRPAVVSIESVFMARNAGSALKLGQARSAALCATLSADVEVFEYSPREIKLAIVGTGAATKEQVQHMIVSLLSLDGAPATDASDALAAAICHGHQRRLQASLGDKNMIAGLR